MFADKDSRSPLFFSHEDRHKAQSEVEKKRQEAPTGVVRISENGDLIDTV